MASLIKIGQRWRAQIRRKGNKPISRTFATKAEATAWARSVEADIDAGRHGKSDPAGVTVGDMIVRYRQLREDSGREIRPTSSERYMLDQLEAGFGELLAERLAVSDVVEWAQGRRRDGVAGATVGMELSKFGTVLRHASAFMGLALPDVLGPARIMLAHLRVIGPAKRRDRRPTAEELTRLIEWFEKQADSPTMLRMPDLLRVSIAVGFRRGELFRLRWEDVDEVRRAVLIRDRKHPRSKAGNDQWVPLLGEAWQVVQRQPRSEARIFPYAAQTVSKYFKKGCDALKIRDLHWHDMRHEAASALIEAGWDVFSVRAVTGHGVSPSDRQLGRYVNADVVQLHERPPARRKV